MKIAKLKKVLEMKKVGWSFSSAVPDDLEIESLSKAYGLGGLPEPPGSLTARSPRIRRDETRLILPWVPGIFPHFRASVSALPNKWDWRNVNGKNWITPVKNQRGCGSCVAFGVTAGVEAHWRIQNENPDLAINMSEASLFFTNNRQCNLGDQNYGWNIPDALNFLVDEGICSEENYPYQGNNQTATMVEGTERTWKITGFDSTTSRSTMKRWLVEEGPLVARYTVYEDFSAFWHGGEGVYQHIDDADNEVRGGHIILVVGYDDTQSCWICKNSWGTHGGENGYFRIKYGDSGIDNRMYLIQDVYRVITHDEISYNPRTLRIVNEGDRGWLLTDGRIRLKMFDNKEDARNGLLVARRHTRMGFIGRSNPRPNRKDYITEYWTGNSGLPYEPLTKTDAIPYNPNNVVAEDLDEQGWRLRDGDHWIELAHDMNDALALLRLIERHSRICFIGRNNRRANRKDYIMTYWE